MVATCGDEAFLMLSLFPGDALKIFLGLFVSGIITGVAVDVVLKWKRTDTTEHLEHYESHHDGARCIPFSKAEFIGQWKKCTPHRGILTLVLTLFLMGIATGNVGHQHLGVDAGEQCHEHVEGAEHHEEEWGWVSITLFAVSLIALLIVATVPEHFLEEHFWHHLVRIHLWKIFLWVFGAMVLVNLLLHFVDVQKLVAGHTLPLLLMAGLIGLIPQSGPHVVFVTLYASGSIPLSVLLVNCIVQDGHGLIPVLSHSRKAFFTIKAGKFVLGLVIGLIAHAFGLA
jgi:hypothetical protein